MKKFFVGLLLSISCVNAIDLKSLGIVTGTAVTAGTLAVLYQKHYLHSEQGKTECPKTFPVSELVKTGGLGAGIAAATAVGALSGFKQSLVVGSAILGSGLCLGSSLVNSVAEKKVKIVLNRYHDGSDTVFALLDGIAWTAIGGTVGAGLGWIAVRATK